MSLRKLCSTRHGGFTLLETVAAVGMIGLFLGVLIAMGSQILGVLRTSKDNIAASQGLQERVEMLRAATWSQITDVTRLSDEVLVTELDSTSGLADATETITISAYPPNASLPIKIQRKRGGSKKLLSENALLTNERMLRMDVSLTWNGPPKMRTHERVVTALIAKTGTIQ